MSQLFAVIASGAVVSAAVNLGQQTLVGFQLPAVTSGDLFLQGNAIDTVSGNFVRVQDTRAVGSGDLRLACGPGSKMVLFPADFLCPSNIRFETVAQTAPCTLTLLTRPRR